MRSNVLNALDNIVTRRFIKLSRLPHIGFFVLTAVPALRAARLAFRLKSDHRVLFYGDSIIAQGFYPADVDLYVRTRFPNLHVRFINSGYSGDSVTGGAADPINPRLKRDVFPFKPNIVTIMLGMNDGRYNPFNQKEIRVCAGAVSSFIP